METQKTLNNQEYHIFFIHSSVDGHLGWFHVLAIVTNAAMNFWGACIFLNTGDKTGCWEQKQSTVHAPCTKHHQSGGPTTQATPLAWPLDLSIRSLHIRNQFAPPGEVSKGSCYLFLPPSCSCRGPCLSFLSDLLSIFIKGRPETLISITATEENSMEASQKAKNKTTNTT